MCIMLPFLRLRNRYRRERLKTYYSIKPYQVLSDGDSVLLRHIGSRLAVMGKYNWTMDSKKY